MAYTGFITRLKNVHKHSNADRLQIGECFGNSVIVSLDYQEGQLGVYFPVDGQLSEEFCKVNDLVRRKDENGNPCGGYLDPEKRNIKALKLRGEKSDGLFLPLTCLANFTTVSDLKEGDTIDILNGVEICKKYIPKRKNPGIWHGRSGKKIKAKHVPTFYEHVDTEQLAYHLNDFRAGDVVELTLKMHGTSGRTGYLPIEKQKKRTLWQKIMRKPGTKYTEYGYVTGTRRVVLDEKHDGGFYDDNTFRREMAKKFDGKLHKGEVVYYEIVGFVNESTPIMATVKNSKISDKAFSKQYGEETVFSYGCDPEGGFERLPEVLGWDEETYAPIHSEDSFLESRCEVYVYRMTVVNEDGDVYELSPEQMRLRCEQMGVKTVPVFEKFIIPVFEVEENIDTTKFPVMTPGEYVLRKVEEYFDGPDPIGKTHIREGVVARIVSRPNIAVYKHKNFSFKVLEGIAKDVADAPDMEESQEEINE